MLNGGPKPRKSKSIAIIPAYNESSNIASVVNQVFATSTVDEVVVMDDGSEDETAAVASSAGATILRLPFNLGIGSTVQLGFMYALKHPYDFVIRLDGDGQHDPLDIQRLLQLLVEGSADVAIGSRFLHNAGYQSSFVRHIGIRYFRFLVTMLTGQKFTDPTSGFRAYTRQAVQFLAEHTPSDYPEIEGLVLLKRAGFQIREVSVTMRPRRSGQSSIKPATSVHYVFKVTLALFINLIRTHELQ
jgi:glycosyltransferase involved in cell wall biosynthesis